MPLYPKQEPPYYTEEGEGIPTKQYIAILNQTGTAAPVPTILKNTIGVILWTRSAPGLYLATLEDAFPANKTTLIAGIDNFLQNGIIYFGQLTPPDELNLQSCLNSFNTPADDIISNLTIQITVYP